MPDFIADFSDSKAWDDYIARHAGPDGGLLQSWAWGEVQRKFGRRVRRPALLDGARIVMAWQMISHRLPLGWSYWYVPRPAALTYQVSNIKYQDFFRHVISLARTQKAVFIRVDGGESLSRDQFGFRSVPGSVQPQEELIMDVRRSETELLAAMKPKTRYNIRLAEKHGVRVVSLAPDETGFNKFWPLVCSTARRQKIRTHAESYYRAMFTTFGQTGTGNLLVAEMSGRPLAAALVVSFNGVITYLHGGSSDESSELMAPYALHWQVIRFAREQGFRAYNFGGVSSTKPSWTGISRFKQGFAPATPFTAYGGLREQPVKTWLYGMYRVARKR